jgi:hypothetical protein
MRFTVSAPFWIPVVVAATALNLVSASQAAAQGCFEHITTRNYSAWNCGASPDLDRVFRLQTITWNDHDYLFLDEGNEIRIFNIDNPLNPVPTGVSDFDIPNIGDSDYDLMSFSVCDDCRYGIANFKAATVLFDLGVGSTPSFGPFSQNDQATQVKGGFTFSAGDQQYLIAASLGATPCIENSSGVYRFNGIDETANPLEQCLIGTNGRPQIANGLSVGSGEARVLYLSDQFDRFDIYRVRTDPDFGLEHVGNGGVSRANMQRGAGVSVDEDAGLMAVASFGDLTIYDIGYSMGSPSAPILLSSMDLTAQPNANAVAIDYPVVHVSKQYSSVAPLTFDVSWPGDPVPLDQDFWDPEEPPNNLGDCVWNNHAVFSDDGSALYLSRYSALQVIDPTLCYGMTPPDVDFTWAPTSPDIGQWTAFEITGVPASEIQSASWVFGGVGCDGSTSYTCVDPHFPDCDVAAFAYADSGAKTVRLAIATTDGALHPQVVHTVEVQDVGSCGASCTYSINPTSRDFPYIGGTGSISVATQAGCSWNTFVASGWITVTAGQSGVGPGTVEYLVDANTGPVRSAGISVQGKTHTINQEGFSPLVFDDGFESGDLSVWSAVAP